MPCLSEFQYTSIALAYHLFIILTLKILPNSIFSIFLFYPLWRPIVILHLVCRLGYITLGIGYNSQIKIRNEMKVYHSGRSKEFKLQIWRSALIKRTFISKAGTYAKYMKEANS